MTNDFPFGAEQPQTCFVRINKLFPRFSIVLSSNTIKQVSDFTAIAYTVMYREAILKHGIPRTKLYVHLTTLLQHVPLFQFRNEKLRFFG